MSDTPVGDWWQFPDPVKPQRPNVTNVKIVNNVRTVNQGGGRQTTNIRNNVNVGGGDAGGSNALAVAGLLVLGVVVVVPVVTALIASVVTLIVTVTLCVAGLGLTGGALYLAREHARNQRLRLEGDLLLTRMRVEGSTHVPAAIVEAKRRALARQLGIRVDELDAIIDVQPAPRRELER